MDLGYADLTDEEIQFLLAESEALKDSAYGAK